MIEQQLRTTAYERYDHFGVLVSVKHGLRGKHREYCLCYDCTLFKPAQKLNCPRAQATYEHCVKWDCVIPMWECPTFCAGQPDLSALRED